MDGNGTIGGVTIRVAEAGSCRVTVEMPKGSFILSVVGPRVYKVRQSQLSDSPQALEQGVFHKIENDPEGDLDEPVNRIVNDFQLVSGGSVPHTVDLCHKNILLLLQSGLYQLKKSQFLANSMIIYTFAPSLGGCYSRGLEVPYFIAGKDDN